MEEENSTIVNKLLDPSKWAYYSVGYKNGALVLLGTKGVDRENTMYISFHKFLWWKWQEVSKPLAALLTKEESVLLKKWAVKQSKMYIVKDQFKR